MKLSTLLAGAAMAVVASAAASANATVVYSSNPGGVTNATVGSYWCSDCYGGGTFEPLDQFTLTSGAAIGGINLQTFADFGYDGLAAFTLEIYNADHSAIVFSQALSPTLLSSQVDTSGYHNDSVTASVTGLHLNAGTYWAGFIAPTFALAGVGGGNGSLIDTVPHTGAVSPYVPGGLGDNTAYQLLGGVPEPAAWALMLTGFLGAGVALRGQRRRVYAAA